MNALVVFSIFAICHSLAALYAPVQDCDEVFNYWEPTHYLTHGYGLQTWEYAPQFAIRSWAYAGLHALILGPLSSLQLLSKQALFVTLRLVLGLACAACETRLFNAVSRTLNERVAILFLIIIASSPGMFHASVAYLPSSFAMYAAMLGASAFMEWRNGLRTAQGIFWFALAAGLGWPFSAALSIPFLLEELLLALLTDRAGRIEFIKRLAFGIGSSLLLLAAQVAIDAVFYRKVTIVPLNIVLYNVFSSRGPDLYGTEPWHFYVRNLALNFHVWLPLALLALPFLLVQMASDKSWTKRTRAFVFLSPFYLWLTIFTLQAHKEERFMYPAYPFLAFNAAYSFNIILSVLGNNSASLSVSRIPVMLRLSAILFFLAAALALSVLRTLGTWTAFSAPLTIYQPLHRLSVGGSVCLGKEWYRFPSHYLLPNGFKAKFVRSEFHGLLPGEFAPATGTNGSYAVTWLEPDGMNDENIEDPGKYVDLQDCDFLVDSFLPSTKATNQEPVYLKDEVQWSRLRCAPFLDALTTSTIPRLIWTPDLPFLPKALRRVYGEYCLLQRRATV
ncbi:hypothetical protein AMS68_001053 [Peltaster fructicola]|uniref:Mannosyltransferase n=1 Tax=Peltaster fructicola TaxID=286661 RepID=A0A6H0XLF4_9PEZI|nr:hypothetical protein AMS68_001053 [Peltaster fructicola]